MMSRTYKWWLVCFDDKKFKFTKKSLALLSARAARSAQKEVKLIEVTKYVQYLDQINAENCKINFWEIDITNQINQT